MPTCVRNANGIVLDAGDDVDYTFAFDAAGQLASDKLYLDGSNGSGHSFALGWTFCDERQMFAATLEDAQGPALSCDCPPLADRTEVTITDAGEGTGTTTWTCDNTYILDGYVFVNSGQTLTIEPGTVIKGATGAGADASAFIVASGGTVNAEALAACPIIFTFAGDPLDGSVSYDTRGQWGGVILLGDASTNFGGIAQIEGIPADNDRASYGGSNDAHSAGIMRYVSIRHGGTQLAAANEINGLTLGGVGSGTTLDHIEVVSNLDDGIEFFGGTASITNAVVAFAGDDSFDWDQGYRGANNANWLAIQDQPNGIGDRGGELDGDDSDDGNVSADEMPFSTPTVTGWTIVGVGGKQGLLFRNGSGGFVSNGLLANVSEGIEIEDKETPEDAFDRWAAGDLTLSNIKVVGSDSAIDYDGSEVADGDAQLDAYADANGIVLDAGDDVDYTFAFDAAGQLASDKLYLDGSNGSGHSFALGWTFCDERQMFAASLDGAHHVPMKPRATTTLPPQKTTVLVTSRHAQVVRTKQRATTTLTPPSTTARALCSTSAAFAEAMTALAAVAQIPHSLSLTHTQPSMTDRATPWLFLVALMKTQRTTILSQTMTIHLAFSKMWRTTLAPQTSTTTAQLRPLTCWSS